MKGYRPFHGLNELNLPAMRFGNALAEVEAKADVSPRAPLRGLVTGPPVELYKHPIPLVERNCRPGIGHLNFNFAVGLGLRAKKNVATSRCMAEGVLNEVLRETSQKSRICVDAQVCGRVQHHVQLFAFGLARMQFCTFAKEWEK